MREILFRGRCRGEWKYGYLTIEPVGYLSKKFELSINEPFDGIKSKIWYIDTETVGQYTGLKDKNGRKIFEGDIVKYNGTIHEVVFEHRNDSAYFGIKMSHIETWGFGSAVSPYMMEVIGNIHDNPELLDEMSSNG